MKPDTHPNYRFIAVRDISCDFEFVTKSSIGDHLLKGTAEIDGVEYPLLTIDISSESHPFYTGTQKLMDTEGRVEAYYRKYGFANPAGASEAKADDDAEASADS